MFLTTSVEDNAMQNNRTSATNGEVSFYNEIRGKKITAVVGHSNRGKGWRPVCGGKFLGEEVFENEGAAISGGKRFISDLTQRVINAESKSQNKPTDIIKATTYDDGTASAEVVRDKPSESSTFHFAVDPANRKSKRSRKKAVNHKAADPVNHD
jgi:hypothetical protein